MAEQAENYVWVVWDTGGDGKHVMAICSTPEQAVRKHTDFGYGRIARVPLDGDLNDDIDDWIESNAT